MDKCVLSRLPLSDWWWIEGYTQLHQVRDRLAEWSSYVYDTWRTCKNAPSLHFQIRSVMLDILSAYRIPWELDFFRSKTHFCCSESRYPESNSAQLIRFKHNIQMDKPDWLTTCGPTSLLSFQRPEYLRIIFANVALRMDISPAFNVVLHIRNKPRKVCFVCKKYGHFLRDCPQRDLYRRRFGYFCDNGDAAAWIISHEDQDIDDSPTTFLHILLMIRANISMKMMSLKKLIIPLWVESMICSPSFTNMIETLSGYHLPVACIITCTDKSLYRFQSSNK